MRIRAASIFVIGLVLLLESMAAPRYVILVEVSPAMARRKEATVRTIHDLVYTGFHRRIQPQETFAVWTYDQVIRTNALMRWDPERPKELASRAAGSLQGRIFRPAQRVDQALAELLSLSPPGGDFSVFVLTEGNQPIIGLPNADVLNAGVTRSGPLFAEKDKPFLMTFLARDRRWLVGAVHSNLLETVQLPAFPPEKPLLAEAVMVLRNAGIAPKAAEAKAPPVQKKEEPQSQPSAPQSPLPAPRSSPPPAPAVAVVKAHVEVELPTRVEPTRKVESPLQTPTPVVQKRVEAEPVIEKKEELKAAAPPAPEHIVKAEPISVVAVVSPSPFPWPLLLSALGLIAAGGSFAYLKVKSRPRLQGSLISQTLPDPARPRSQKW